jgi:hypothetical protein
LSLAFFVGVPPAPVRSCTATLTAHSPLVVVTASEGLVPDAPVAVCGLAALNVVAWSTPSKLAEPAMIWADGDTVTRTLFAPCGDGFLRNQISTRTDPVVADPFRVSATLVPPWSQTTLEASAPESCASTTIRMLFALRAPTVCVQVAVVALTFAPAAIDCAPVARASTEIAACAGRTAHARQATTARSHAFTA